MKEKLEKLAQERLIAMCCDCRAIRVDEDTWINEDEAHKKGLHHQYLEISLRATNVDPDKKITHTYCQPCYEVQIKEIDEAKIQPILISKIQKYKK